MSSWADPMPEMTDIFDSHRETPKIEKEKEREGERKKNRERECASERGEKEENISFSLVANGLS